MGCASCVIGFYDNTLVMVLALVDIAYHNDTLVILPQVKVKTHNMLLCRARIPPPVVSPPASISTNLKIYINMDTDDI